MLLGHPLNVFCPVCRALTLTLTWRQSTLFDDGVDEFAVEVCSFCGWRGVERRITDPLEGTP